MEQNMRIELLDVVTTIFHSTHSSTFVWCIIHNRRNKILISSGNGDRNMVADVTRSAYFSNTKYTDKTNLPSFNTNDSKL